MRSMSLFRFICFIRIRIHCLNNFFSTLSIPIEHFVKTIFMLERAASR